MKVLFDHNVPHKLRRFLPGHYIQNAVEMKWTALANGVLLKAAEREGFDVMLTCDQNIHYQQNLNDRTLSLVVLTTNNWNHIKPHTQDVLAAISAAYPGSFFVVPIPS